MVLTPQKVALRLVDEVVNGGRLELIDELVHPDFYDHGATPSRSCGPGINIFPQKKHFQCISVKIKSKKITDTSNH